MAIENPQVIEFLDELASLTKSFDSQIANATDDLLKVFLEAEKRIFARVAEIVASGGDLEAMALDQRLVWYAERQAEIQQAVTRNFPAGAIDNYLADYPRLAAFAEDTLALGGRVPKGLAKIPDELIELLRGRDKAIFSNFLNIEAVEALDAAFLENAVLGISRADLLAELKGVITGDYAWGTRRGLYEWHAGTYARTAQARTARMFHVGKARELGITKYLYVGPADAKTRPFCREWVGEILTEAQINELDNGQTGLVLADGGGYNCRHQWVAVGDEMAGLIGEESKGDIQLSFDFGP